VKGEENLKSSYFAAGAIDRNTNITIFVYVPAQKFKEYFPFKTEGWMFSKVKITDNQTAYTWRKQPK